jgi:hypothetical protein
MARTIVNKNPELEAKASSTLQVQHLGGGGGGGGGGGEKAPTMQPFGSNYE